ncbi:MAG TPA: conjugal transfer protein TrbF [Acidobacteria bacterium]|nr:conjugal transfer protein TrbF [Acidobacteriota bacterium]
MSHRSPENPFLRARDEWDNRLMDLATSRYNWMLFATALFVLDALLCGALVWQAGRSKVVPYVVEVDRHGQAVAFGPAEVLAKPQERLYRYFLSVLIRDLRTVSPDPQAQRRALNNAYTFLREPATSRASDYFRHHNPFEPERAATTVQVTSVLQIADTTWQIQWTETSFSRDGRRLKEELWQAVVKTVWTPPTTSEALLANPLGLFVEQLDWTRIRTTTDNTP